MKVNAAQIAEVISGRIIGDREKTISNIAKIEEATPSDLAFLGNSKYQSYLADTKAGVLVISQKFVKDEAPTGTTYIVVEDAQSSFAYLIQLYANMASQQELQQGIADTAIVHATASVSSEAYVGPMCIVAEGASVAAGAQLCAQVYIGKDAVIGANSILNPGVKVMHDCTIGSQCILHANVVIGSDGFGFQPNDKGVYSKVPQLGNVVVGDNVEIGANTTIDRATMGSTRIGNGVKLDNLVQVAHNVVIGQNTVVAAQAGISGSTKIGAQCIIGGQAGIVGHISLADGTKINAQSGVTKTITENNKALTGSPAAEYYATLKSQSVFRQLPELLQRIAKLEEQIKTNR